MIRTNLTSFTGPDAARQVAAEQSRLEAAHLSTFKKRLDPAVLSVSSWGPVGSSTLGLVAYTKDFQKDTLAFLRAESARTAAQLAVA